MHTHHISSARIRAIKIETASDYHKAVFGHRPRQSENYTEDDWIACYEKCSDYIKKCKSTPKGRSSLRTNGWIIPLEEDDIEYLSNECVKETSAEFLACKIIIKKFDGDLFAAINHIRTLKLGGNYYESYTKSKS